MQKRPLIQVKLSDNDLETLNNLMVVVSADIGTTLNTSDIMRIALKQLASKYNVI